MAEAMGSETASGTGTVPLIAPGELARLRLPSEAALADSIEDIPPELAARFGIQVRRFGSAVAQVVAGVPSPLFNRVVNLGALEPATEQDVDRLFEIYRSVGAPFMVQLSPIASPAELPAWLERRGAPAGEPWVVFVRGLEEAPGVSTVLRVEEIGPERAMEFAETLSAGYGIPPALAPLVAVPVGRTGWHHYLALEGDTPVAAASMFVAGRLARLTGAATLEAHRGRGAQGALLAGRLRDAAAAGCTVATSETGPGSPQKPNASYRNMLRAGFQPVFLLANHVFTPTC
jgi:hypothetical protein